MLAPAVVVLPFGGCQVAEFAEIRVSCSIIVCKVGILAKELIGINLQHTARMAVVIFSITSC